MCVEDGCEYMRRINKTCFNWYFTFNALMMALVCVIVALLKPIENTMSWQMTYAKDNITEHGIIICIFREMWYKELGVIKKGKYIIIYNLVVKNYVI